MAEGFDDFDKDNFDTDKLEDYTDDQLNNHFDEISLAKDSLYKKYGDNENTPEYVRVIYGKSKIETGIIEKERDRREEMRSKEDSLYRGKTLLLDDDIRYKKTDLGTLKTYGGVITSPNLLISLSPKTARLMKMLKVITLTRLLSLLGHTYLCLMVTALDLC